MSSSFMSYSSRSSSMDSDRTAPSKGSHRSSPSTSQKQITNYDVDKEDDVFLYIKEGVTADVHMFTSDLAHPIVGFTARKPMEITVQKRKEVVVCPSDPYSPLSRLNAVR